jgi:hypothetical protein
MFVFFVVEVDGAADTEAMYPPKNKPSLPVTKSIKAAGISQSSLE